MRRKTVKYKNFKVTIQEEMPQYEDRKGYALTLNNGNDILLKYDETDTLSLVHEVMHSIQDQQHFDELMALCNYDQKLYLILSEKIATIGENMAAIIFIDEKKQTKKVFEKMEQLAKEIGNINKESSDQGKLDNSKLSKITQPIEQNHTKDIK
ncbi:MAG: hypothetical protein PHE51_10320 [Eubacteriales bacterium]|nr:hypothetical protein [Eubacteriales bacterium]